MDLLQQLLFCLCFTPLALLWGGCCCQPGCPCYKLTNCEDSGDFFYSDTNLSAYVGRVVRVSEYFNLCWAVSCEEEECDTVESVTVVDDDDECEECLGSLEFFCVGGCVTPSAVSLTVSGIIDGACGSCSGLNGSFVLDRCYVYPLETPPGGETICATYIYLFPSPVCGVLGWHCVLRASDGGLADVRMISATSGGSEVFCDAVLIGPPLWYGSGLGCSWSGETFTGWPFETSVGTGCTVPASMNISSSSIA